MSMKWVFIFTLTVLFALACVFLTNLTAFESDSDSGDVWAGNVWGNAYVSVWFEFPRAWTQHSVSLSNPGPVPIRYYWRFEGDVDGPTDKFPTRKENDGWVEINGWWSTSKNISFNMRGARRGRYTVEGTTDLTVKADFNGDGDFDAIEGWDASASEYFNIE